MQSGDPDVAAREITSAAHGGSQHQIDRIAGGVLDNQRPTNETLGTFVCCRLARQKAVDGEVFRRLLEFRLAGNLDADTRPIRPGSETQRVVTVIGAKEKRLEFVGNVLEAEDSSCEGGRDLRLRNRKSHIAKLDGGNARRQLFSCHDFWSRLRGLPGIDAAARC